jgi:hypothetical protein
MVAHTYTLTTQEAEVEGFQIPGQPGEVVETLSQKQNTKQEDWEVRSWDCPQHYLSPKRKPGTGGLCLLS